jgi:hypothetical protein
VLTENGLIKEDLTELVEATKDEIKSLKQENSALEMEVTTLKWYF